MDRPIETRERIGTEWVVTDTARLGQPMAADDANYASCKTCITGRGVAR